MSGYHIAVAGATGAVGKEILGCLERRNFPVASLRLLASQRSVGKTLEFTGEAIEVEELTHDSFGDIDIVLSSTSGTLSKEFTPSAVKAGAVVIDNTSAYRMDPDVPLVVPEVNPDDAAGHPGIIANPNCSTIIAVLPLWPLHKEYGMRQLVACTYQAVSGAGAAAMAELEMQTRAILNGESAVAEEFSHPIAFNVFSHDSDIGDSGYNTEEMKMLNETRKMFHDDRLRISATCVRVPVFRSHTEALHVSFSRPVDVDGARKILAAAPGVDVLDDRENNHFPMPRDVEGTDNVCVGRIRRDTALENGLALFVAGDQLLKGAALNAVQIAELLVRGTDA